MRSARAVAAFGLVWGLVVSSGCARVKPWQRERLAAPCMSKQMGETGFSGAYRAKLTESKTGGGVPGSAPGGGCGCTQ